MNHPTTDTTHRAARGLLPPRRHWALSSEPLCGAPAPLLDVRGNAKCVRHVDATRPAADAMVVKFGGAA